MKNPPTYEDANLILRLYELRREEKLREARKWIGGIAPFTSREQWLGICPPGSETNAYYRMVTTYWDMAAAFVATGVLNRELFFRANNMELLFVWEKVKRMLPEIREVQKNPRVMFNLEEVANGFIEYMNTNTPGYYEVFAGNIAKMIPAADAK
ncbi:MAG TPA: hypothetical protein VJ032_12390 [Thermoanaerobaculia bacterium]|nr:hypothetical protein [Thermoanaerobaculia bacterium]